MCEWWKEKEGRIGDDLTEFRCAFSLTQFWSLFPFGTPMFVSSPRFFFYFHSLFLDTRLQKVKVSMLRLSSLTYTHAHKYRSSNPFYIRLMFTLLALRAYWIELDYVIHSYVIVWNVHSAGVGVYVYLNFGFRSVCAIWTFKGITFSVFTVCMRINAQQCLKNINMNSISSNTSIDRNPVFKYTKFTVTTNS